MCAYSTELHPLPIEAWANAGQWTFLQKAAGREGDVGVKHALGAHCARIVNKYLTAAATLGCLCGALAVLQEFGGLLSARADGLSASAERKSCCNWFLNEGSSAAPRRLGGLKRGAALSGVQLADFNHSSAGSCSTKQVGSSGASSFRACRDSFHSQRECRELFGGCLFFFFSFFLSLSVSLGAGRGIIA